MKGPFAFLLILGGAVLLYGLFTGKINLGNAGLNFGTSPTLLPGVPGSTAALPGTKCPAGTSPVAGSCRQDPHKCGAGMVWLDPVGKCVPVVA